MHVFDCIYIIYNNDFKRRKLDSKEIRCKLLDYERSNQYRIWDIAEKRTIRASYIDFNDSRSSKQIEKKDDEVF